MARRLVPPRHTPRLAAPLLAVPKQQPQTALPKQRPHAEEQQGRRHEDAALQSQSQHRDRAG
eukprot:6307385-Lingulodinium_polyedra.AAC.1